MEIGLSFRSFLLQTRPVYWCVYMIITMQFFTFIISQKSACHIYNIMKVSARPRLFGETPTASKIKRPSPYSAGYDVVRATTKSDAFKWVDSSLIDDILLIILIIVPNVQDKSALSRAVVRSATAPKRKCYISISICLLCLISILCKKYRYPEITTVTQLNVFNEPSRP